MFCTGYLPTTATSEWTTFETIGGLQPTPEGLIDRPGLFIDAMIPALARDRRCEPVELDRALGRLFTCLQAAAVVLLFKRKGSQDLLLLVPAGIDPPRRTDAIRVSANWRIIATMNVFDKNLFFDMSYALMRRFAFIEVGTQPRRPTRAAPGPGGHRRQAPAAAESPIWPAVYIDAAVRRSPGQESASPASSTRCSRHLLLQFEGMEDLVGRSTLTRRRRAPRSARTAQAQRTIRRSSGVELASEVAEP